MRVITCYLFGKPWIEDPAHRHESVIAVRFGENLAGRRTEIQNLARHLGPEWKGQVIGPDSLDKMLRGREGNFMLTMQPLMILAESETTDGAQRYRVRFDCQGKEIEYVFTVSTENDITGVTAEEEFTNSTFQDPLSSTLCQAILKFHESRQR